MANHKVKLHKWINGILHTTEHIFGSRHDAVNFAKKSDCHTAKIIDPMGSLVHEEVKSAVNTNTYA